MDDKLFLKTNYIFIVYKFKIILLFIIFINLFFSIFYSYKFKEENKEEFNDNDFNNKYKILKRLSLSKEFNKIYSTLYFEARKGNTEKPNFSNAYKLKNYDIRKKKGLSICTIGKNENLYAKEFVEYYHLLGFDKIIIFDNNDINGEKFEDVLKDYIDNKFVQIFDIRGLLSVQIPVLNYCYNKFQKLFDWMAFIDFDEYLYINDSYNINDYIYNKRFKKCQSILFNWVIYGDNNLDKYENEKLNIRFNHSNIILPTVKSMVRGGLNGLLIPTTHIVGININYFCDSNGIRVFPNSYYQIEYNNKSKAYIKHFYTKTVEEFCKKIRRTDAQFDRNYWYYNTRIINRIDLFFLVNKKNEKKIKFFEKCTGLNLKKYK